MCGFTGFIDLQHERPAEQETLAKMTGKLVHRGPNSDGYFVEEVSVSAFAV